MKHGPIDFLKRSTTPLYYTEEVKNPLFYTPTIKYKVRTKVSSRTTQNSTQLHESMQATGGNADALVRAGGAAPPQAVTHTLLDPIPALALVKYKYQIVPFANLEPEVQQDGRWTVRIGDPLLQNASQRLHHGVEYKMSLYDLAGIHAKVLQDPLHARQTYIACMRNAEGTGKDGQLILLADLLCKMGVYKGQNAQRDAHKYLKKAAEMCKACEHPSCSGKGEHVLCPVTKGAWRFAPFVDWENEKVSESLFCMGF